MPTNAPLLHLTLNTGHVASTPGLTPPEELAAVHALLKRGGPISNRAPFRVNLDRQRGSASFCLFHRKLTETMNLVAWEDAAARAAWPEIEFFYQELADLCPGAVATRACPPRPKTTPWSATLILPSLHHVGQSPEELAWVAAFERSFAEALLADVVTRTVRHPKHRPT
ncbi:MAG: hypothetical protein RL514_4412 [Verrucomicrobiota bacterium]|jgi:hypothetical protein